MAKILFRLPWPRAWGSWRRISRALKSRTAGFGRRSTCRTRKTDTIAERGIICRESFTACNTRDTTITGPWVQRRTRRSRLVYEGRTSSVGLVARSPVPSMSSDKWDGRRQSRRPIHQNWRRRFGKADEGQVRQLRVVRDRQSREWTVGKSRDSIDFTQELTDFVSGYGYIYRKTLRLVKGKPEMVLEHSLKNTGSRPIRTTVYNHNFLVLDNQPPGAPLAIHGAIPDFKPSTLPTKNWPRFAGTGSCT